LPLGCGTVSASSVVCNFTSTNGSPAVFAIPVFAPFVRDLNISAEVESGSADSTPGDNSASDSVPVRVRPFARIGLPARQP
jgi:hypothetical protein